MPALPHTRTLWLRRALPCVPQRPSDAGEGAASPYRAKSGSGREPIKVGPACASEGAPGCRVVAGPKPSDKGEGAVPPAGRGPGLAGRPLGWGSAQIQPARPEARQAALLQGRRSGRSQATQGGCSLSLPGKARVGPGLIAPLHLWNQSQIEGITPLHL